MLIAVGGTIVEDAGNSWAAVYLADSLGAVASVAAFGFIALVGAQFVGRLIGDRLVDRFGQRAVARAGGLIAAGGMGLPGSRPPVSGWRRSYRPRCTPRTSCPASGPAPP